jgi:hypothetical protein
MGLYAFCPLGGESATGIAGRHEIGRHAAHGCSPDSWKRSFLKKARLAERPQFMYEHPVYLNLQFCYAWMEDSKTRKRVEILQEDLEMFQDKVFVCE